MLLLTHWHNDSFLLSTITGGKGGRGGSTFGPSFPGFPIGPLTPGSPCLNNKSHIIQHIILRRIIWHAVLYFRDLFSDNALHSLLAWWPLLPLLSRKPGDPGLARAAGVLSARARQEAKVVAQLGLHQVELERCPLLCRLPWVEDKTPTDTNCSLNVCHAEIMRTPPTASPRVSLAEVSGELCQTHWLWHLSENLKYHCPCSGDAGSGAFQVGSG